MKRCLLPKRFYYISIAIIGLLLNSFYGIAQTKKVTWSELSNNKGASFYDVQKNFRKEWKEKLREMAREKAKGKKEEEEKEEGGFEVYKRWEAFMAPRVYPSGNMALPSMTYPNFMAWQQTTGKQFLNRGAGTLSTGNWTALGPVGSPSGPSPYTRTGAGRTNFVRFHPTSSNIMYVGAPDGGLWKSTNGGTTWTTNTDFLTIIGCSDLAIDPTNTQVMYLATGDLEGNRRSIGILKSTNGGTTWTTTGLTFTALDDYKISKLLMNPSNPLNMIISTDGGTFRTTDGWATSTQGSFPGGAAPDLKDMEFKPGDANIVYAAGKQLFKSTDNGINWTQITTGLPASNIQRIALGVTPGNAAYVYALIGKVSNQSFLGMYRSTDDGTSFSLRSSTPNLLGYNTNGLDAGGQAFYDLAIAVSPTDAEIVTTGGVNHWQSVNGGTNWTNLSFWASGEVHADIHEISYLPGSSTTMFSCNDGGIFKSTDNGNNFTDISNNLTIAQNVGIGLSADIATTIVNGTQDNGTNLKTGSSWANIFGGDGGECFIDYTNNNTIYLQYVQGDFNRSDNGGATTTSISSGLPAVFDFYSTWLQDPVNPSRLYVGGIPTLYTSANKGGNWTALATPFGTGSIKGIAVAPSNTAIIYTVKDNAVSKSINSGTSFSNITGTLPVANAALTSIAVSNTDPNKIWVTFSGYSAGNKVFKSVDGGTSWTNVSAGLPNLPVNIAIFTKGSANDAIYIGADIGVYYLDNTLSSFSPFMTALPNCAVRDLEIFYPTGKIRAGTFGRGVWESDLYVSPVTNYTITASAGANGAITPNGAATLTSGANQAYTITPNACYQIATVLVDGVNDPAAVSSGTYTFNNVTANHTISATFVLRTYNITATAGANGTITPNGATVVNCGSNQTFTITPATCYQTATVLVDGTNNPTAVSSGTYTFSNVTAVHTISATFSTTGPEINVTGNTVSIVDGDNTPSAADHTDFGNVTTGSNLVRTFTIQNSGTPNLTVTGITLTGTNASLFTVGGISFPATITTGGSATFTLTFAPTSTGLKTATVHIANNDCDEADYDYAVQGTGTTVPVITYYPKTSATDLSEPSQWTDAPSGTGGTSPLNFSSANQLFNVNNNVANPVVSTAWTIAGASNVILTNTNGLTFNSSSSLSVGAGSTFDFNNKLVTLKSNSSGTAYISTISGMLSNATNVTIERYISAASNRAYRQLTPTVNTTLTTRVNWQENGSNAPGYGTHITGSTIGANGFDATGTGAASLFTNNPVTHAWDPVANTNVNTLNAKTGYLIFIRGDRTINLFSTASPLPSTNTTLRANGSLVTGAQSFTGLIGNSGFSLVTNPYPAPINWASVYTGSTDLAQFYTFWDPNIGSRGAYVTVSTAGVKSNASSNATTSIQSGQAFFVQAFGVPAPVVNIAEADKTTSNNVDVFRAGIQTETFATSLFFTDASNIRRNADGVTSVFNNSYSAAVDGNDADKIDNFDEDIAIVRGTHKLSIEARPLVDITDTIPLFISNFKVQNYEWQFDVSNFNAPGLQAFLADKFTNSQTAIILNQQTIIPFAVTANAASSATDRFMIVFGSNNPLPVNLSFVRAYQKGKDIQVEWTAQSEYNLDRYEVEKSTNGLRFDKVGTVGALNLSNSTYNWLDVNANDGNNYYHIKTIDRLGAVQYSKIVNVHIGKNNVITVYPNPLKNNSFVLSMQLPAGRYSMVLTNKLGQQVYKNEVNHPGGSATQTFTINNKLAAGIYQLKISGDAANYVQQVVIE